MSRVLTQRWRFSCIDSWFFREARPHDAVGVTRLASMFPPPQATVLGAARHLIATAKNVDWQAFSVGRAPEIEAIIGRSDDMGQLTVLDYRLLWCRGEEDEQPLYPLPAALIPTGDQNGATRLYRLKVGAPVSCDLGRCCLPELPDDARARNAARYWLTEAGFYQWLRGGTPDVSELVDLYQQQLLAEEPRLGIARNNRQRTVSPGLLYQSTHLRLADSLKLDLYLKGVPDELALAEIDTPPAVLRLGGEGRPASVDISVADPPELPVFASPDAGQMLVIMLLSDGDFSQHSGGEAPGWCLPGFTPVQSAARTQAWQGSLPEFEGVQLLIHSAALAQPRRLGGWDLAKRGPRPVRSLIPAGSCYYCEILTGGTASEVVPRINRLYTGKDTRQGLGRLVAGCWPQQERPAALSATKDTLR